MLILIFITRTFLCNVLIKKLLQFHKKMAIIKLKFSFLSNTYIILNCENLTLNHSNIHNQTLEI